MELAIRHLAHLPRGIEIGASSVAPFEGVRAWNLELPAADLYEAAQARQRGKVAPVHVYGDGSRLPVPDGALDFVLASHVLEHMPDTIRCLGEWDRVLRPGGIVFLILPHRERTSDRVRPRTELEHHLADHAMAATVANSPMPPTSHYHVWITEDLLRLYEHLNQVGYLDWEVLDVEDVDSHRGNGFTVVARKRGNVRRPTAAEPGPIAFHHLAVAFPFQIPARTVEFIVPGAEPELPPFLPRGTYAATPIHTGFPPTAGATVSLAVGDPVPAPEIADVRLEGCTLRIRGRHFSPTTFIAAQHPDGVPRLVLPECDGDELVLDLSGLVFPDAPLPVRAVNLPPGGGPGTMHELVEHLPLRKGSERLPNGEWRVPPYAALA